MNLFITADTIGVESGGGKVTHYESEALKSLGPCEAWGREQLLEAKLLRDQPMLEPWGWDYAAEILLGQLLKESVPELAHFYSGTFGNCVGLLKSRGIKITYTVAAHDRQISKEEHEKLGIPFNYPHLTEEGLWQRYIDGYRAADVIICPSSVARETVFAYGPRFREKRIEVIPHGCELPARAAELPARFTVGYLGAYGADKGVRYLLEAWKKLAYKDAVLMLGGRDSQTAGRALYNTFGGGNVIFMGWIKNVSDFYNQLSLYVQPSATEGFGIEVLEALAHARPVFCSENAGAADVVPKDWRVKARDAKDLANMIEWAREGGIQLEYKELTGREWLDQGHYLPRIGMGRNYPAFSAALRDYVSQFSWDKIRQRYIDLWRSLL